MKNVILQDKTGTIDSKIWDPNSSGIGDFEVMDYVFITGDVTNFQGTLQLNIKQIRKAQEDEYVAADYMPTSEKSTEGMYRELLGYVSQIENTYLRQAVRSIIL